MVLEFAVGPEPGRLALGRLVRIAGYVPVLVPGHGFVFLAELEVGAGGIEEQQVHLEVQQVRDLVKDLPLLRILDLVQPVHRPVARVISGLGQPVDPGLAAHPAAAASLEDGSRARLATSANSTRSAAASRRVLLSLAVMIAPMPSRCHSWSSSNGPPKATDPQ